MKATIKYTDGKTIELEGTQEEVSAVLGWLTWNSTPISVPSVFGYYDLPNFCLHEYPPSWWGTTQPSCKKCGQTMSTVRYYESGTAI